MNKQFELDHVMCSNSCQFDLEPGEVHLMDALYMESYTVSRNNGGQTVLLPGFSWLSHGVDEYETHYYDVDP